MKGRDYSEPWRQWEDNIKMDLKWYSRDYILLDEDRNQWLALVNTVMNLRLPYQAANFNLLTSKVR
jgi:hypothetical protein